MPTYEYACTACAERFEIVQSFTDASLTECPSCAGRLRKVFSPVGVVFKGSGFYKTDSRDSASKTAKKSEPKSGTSSSGDSSSSGGSDAGSTSTDKPAAASAPAKTTPSGGSGSTAAAAG